MPEISRKKYVELYGPTVGDGIRLADTNLIISPTQDLTRGGDESVFGGGKVIRESMGMGHYTREYCADLVIVGGIVLDAFGIIKADIAIKDGLIVGIGKSGNPKAMDNVTESMIIGPSTEIISGFGKIVTAGGIDCHVHFICPDVVRTALFSGITTLIGGGTGPAEGTKATTVTPGKFNVEMMLKALDHYPVNTVLLGKGNSVNEEALTEQLVAGCSGFKIHEDWGATPAVIDKCLEVSTKEGVMVAIHTDTLNEAGYLESTIKAINNRPIHTYHTEGAGGGHAPDIIKVASLPNILPSSTNPTRPFTVNTIDEHLDMLMVCHHLNPALREDLSFAESRIRPSTIAAEDYLHDMGAISMIGSDSQAMGRIGEVIIRTWQTAHVMKSKVGLIGSGEPFDNFRARRYIAKYTICPAICHGLDNYIGSIEVGKLADLVIWDPQFFGVKPDLVLKGGTIVSAIMGDANASIPTTEPRISKEMFGYLSAGTNSISFVSKRFLDSGRLEALRLEKKVIAASNTSELKKSSLPLNDACPEIEVNSDTFQVMIDGETVPQEPVEILPMTQRYFLF